MTAKIHSPFLVFDHFISPANCERLIEELAIREPSRTDDGIPLKHERILSDVEHVQLIKTRLEEQIGLIESQYFATVTGLAPAVFQQHFENPNNPCEGHGCENSRFIRKKWVKTKDVDLVGYLWLKDFNNGVPLDPRHEVYGGKLEFPAYDFSIVPQRGTLVLYPAGPHFITAISPVLVGSLEQIKITIRLKQKDGGIWLYQPANFAGTYQDWFVQE
jgi:hypothetical protein